MMMKKFILTLVLFSLSTFVSSRDQHEHYGDICGKAGAKAVKMAKETQQCLYDFVKQYRLGSLLIRCPDLKFVGGPGKETDPKYCKKNNSLKDEWDICYDYYRSTLYYYSSLIQCIDSVFKRNKPDANIP
ncbi:uncharacterized protein LOC141851953 [Brevipalpus obovatus]|uniref:uncharacterized protein LOC141851953 n=1 Tax=Brevipalpus obovatus TaxID=246614 RepID=UPI003D9DEA7B